MASQGSQSANQQGDSYERHVAQAFERKGCQILWPPANTKHYDFSALKNNVRLAVKVKALNKPAGLAPVKQFAAFMNSGEALPFKLGYLVTSDGLTKGAKEFIELNAQFRLRHWCCKGSRFYQTAGLSEVTQRRIGVYTFKGGVGKTKLSLLLACALAWRGHDAVLIDLNRAQNLYNLVGEEGLYLEAGEGPGNVITVFSHEEWDFRKDAWKAGPILDADYLVYDCPQFFEKKAERDILKNFDLILAPLHLSIDSIGVNHTVIRDTIAEIRAINPTVWIFFTLNYLKSDQWKGPLREFLLSAKHVFSANDRVRLLPPERYAIPYSKHLEELGTYRALNPGRKIEVSFSEQMNKGAQWGKNLVRLVDDNLLKAPT